jgi:CDP-diglyceride synthetase
MTDDVTDDDDTSGVEEDPPSYRSGRVRIIGAEPAGDAIREVTGPVVEEHADMPHWNDAPTGQVPAILDRATGDEPTLAPPIWREEHTDWAAHEELFEPSMLSDDLPAVGSLVNDNNEQVDVERQPWHFESELPGDEATLILEPGYEPEPAYLPAPEPEPDPDPVQSLDDAALQAHFADYAAERNVEPGHEAEAAPARLRPRPRPRAADAEAAASRLTPPSPPQPKVRAPRVPRTSRQADDVRNANPGGTAGRNMRQAIGTGVVFGVVALLCFAEGSVSSLVLCSAVILLAAAEAFAAFRRGHYHPATLLGLVATLSLEIETYNKGVSALPLMLILLVAASFIWYLSGVEKGADPVSGLTSTIFVFAWVGGLGSFSALLLNPNLFPHRHGVAFLLAAVLTTVAADVGGLLVGSAIGRHPLAPSISPNKSWEGFIGGAITTLVVALLVGHFLHPWTISKALVLGVVVAVVAPLGDLGQSMIKRQIGVKDMGRLMPGHGGILDRVDGLLLVLPATYFVVKALHLG